jgi:hypothetical protein
MININDHTQTLPHPPWYQAQIALHNSLQMFTVMKRNKTDKMLIDKSSHNFRIEGMQELKKV